jgi:hypothetical protein
MTGAFYVWETVRPFCRVDRSNVHESRSINYSFFTALLIVQFCVAQLERCFMHNQKYSIPIVEFQKENSLLRNRLSIVTSIFSNIDI